ncbi:MAG: class I SAM-dependent methyltransferase [Accumulibacter sp.]|jgi:ubiquinone/menaquinone biosynthesis C-methylase UbiE|uniref:class I SAM-dependent methyltransferase n=1 Tax=Accumulibacter sp. TaxID=2053492 RepID=UPI002FC3848B
MSGSNLPTPIRLLPLLLAQQIGSQELGRTPEPSAVTAADPNVLQYDRVMGTKLAVVYGAGLALLHRALPPRDGGRKAIDLACGPGHYTLCLARYLGFESVTGVDLSPGMVSAAARNAAEYQLQDRVSFRQGDITRLDDIDGNVFDLASFTGAAHHLTGIDDVRQVLRQMDRITRPEGLVMLMDLVRLRTADITERYINIIGHDYIERGLPNFYEDFRNSMYAAYTPEELRKAIPTDTARNWCHLVPRGLPGAQIVLGLPEGRSEPLLRAGFPWQPGQGPVPREMRNEWWFLSTTLGMAGRSWVHASDRAA